MKKLLTLLMGLLLSVGMMSTFATTSTAQPAKVVVTPGMNLDVGRDGYGCTMGAVGTDRSGNLVGISAGHCLQTGTQVFFPGKRDLGPIGVTTFSYPNGGAPGGEPDYSVVKYDPAKVVLDSDGRIRVDGIAPLPRPFQSITKAGSTTGVSSGVYTYTQPNGNYNGYIFVLPGDSGGPLAAGTKWLGITSRIDFNIRGPFSFASAHAILADMSKRGIVGSGFVPVNA